MKGKRLYHFLDLMLEKSLEIPLSHHKIVIFSDLHIGDGSGKDDFLRNSDLFIKSLKEYYFPNKYSLVLNGDVEELQRHSLKKIHTRWKEVFDLFDAFDRKGKFFKNIGNHDIAFSAPNGPKSKYPVHESLRIKREAGDFYLFHGHQLSSKYIQLNSLLGMGLKYVANPLRIGNYSISHNNRKQYNIEKKAYHYSCYRRIASIIGHTHRPLFESLSKAERLRHEIEVLCRQYSSSSVAKEKESIKKTIKSRKKELRKIVRKQSYKSGQTHLYNELYHIPCLFNSGCVIGKRGITCLELDDKEIALVHWFDESISKRYLHKRGYEPEALKESKYYRMVLNKEDLSYIFTRINLLGG